MHVASWCCRCSSLLFPPFFFLFFLAEDADCVFFVLLDLRRYFESIVTSGLFYRYFMACLLGHGVVDIRCAFCF